MPRVVVKVLRGRPEEYASERAAYLAIEEAKHLERSAFPSLISHNTFRHRPHTIPVDYFVLEYLGPTLHDVMMHSCYTRFTTKMTMAVAIQLVCCSAFLHRG